MDVYSIGEMVIDFTPGEEEASYIRNAGGAPANLAISVARNGLSAGMLCSVGEDDFGRFLQDTLREHGVEVLKPERCSEAVTTMAFVSLNDEGERTFVFARKPGADMFLCEDDVREEDIDRSVIVHGGSCSLSKPSADAATRKALRLGHERGRLVSFDVNYRDLLWDGDEAACAAAVREVLPYVDLLKVSDEEVRLFGGSQAIPELMEQYDITAVVETLGSRGARCYLGDAILDVSGRPANCVDATAAGDAFWGGVLASLRQQGVTEKSQLTDEVLRQALHYGNASGGLCVQCKGAICALPSREEIVSYLDEANF